MTYVVAKVYSRFDKVVDVFKSYDMNWNVYLEVFKVNPVTAIAIGEKHLSRVENC